MGLFGPTTSGGGGGGSSNSFEIIQPDTGTSPTASSSTDTLTITSPDSSLDVAGNSSTKTLNLTVNPDWTSYTPSVVNFGGSSITLGGTTVFICTYMLWGKHLSVRLHIQLTGVGSSGSGSFRFSLPGSYTVNTSLISTGDFSRAQIGHGAYHDGNAGGNGLLGVYMYDSSTFAAFATPAGADFGTTVISVGSTSHFSINIPEIPIN